MAQTDDLGQVLNAPPRYFDNGSGARFFNPRARTMITTSVITTAVTGTFGFATQAQGDALVAGYNLMFAALVSAGIIKTITSPAT